MRNEKEIGQFIGELKNTVDTDDSEVYNRIAKDEDYAYFTDVTETLSWARIKISGASTDKEINDIETELRELDKNIMTYLSEGEEWITMGKIR